MEIASGEECCAVQRQDGRKEMAMKRAARVWRKEGCPAIGDANPPLLILRVKADGLYVCFENCRLTVPVMLLPVYAPGYPTGVSRIFLRKEYAFVRRESALL